MSRPTRSNGPRTSTFRGSVFATLALTPLLFQSVIAQTLEVQGQLSTWGIANTGEGGSSSLGVRYLPTLAAEKPVATDRIVDAEFSANAYASGATASSGREAASRLRLYRAWFRFKTPRYEARVGLQKLNFGSATLLRPLMWFDSVDPRDPLQITDGVYAGLFRYYWPGRATAWVWTMYGNTSLRGLDSSPTRARRPEVGGRIELPMARGQIAATTHHREVDLQRGLEDTPAPAVRFVPEHRYALDGKWDLGVGVWLEGTYTHQGRTDSARPDQRAMAAGLDYTFPLGHGLYALGEVLQIDRSSGAFGPGEGNTLVASTLRYPLGLLDAIAAIVYLDRNRHDVYRFVSWQRTYDEWQFHVMGFWNPALANIQPGGAGQNVGRSPLSGKGGQVLAVFNHRLLQKGPRNERLMVP